jgi:SAM-dependent methyltransferase
MGSCGAFEVVHSSGKVEQPMTSRETAHSDANERLLALLTAESGSPDTSEGWVDLLGSPRRPLTLARLLMESSSVPTIYTRYWRPALGWLAKGLNGPSMRDEFRLAIELLALRSGDVVLDVGCGPGNFTRPFAAAVGPAGLAIGLDASVPMLRRAVGSGSTTAGGTAGRPAYLRADAVRPPLQPGSLDAVCCFAALHMFEEPEQALTSFRRLLRPGGRIALLTSARRSAPLGSADALLGRLSGMRMFSRREVVDQLTGLGFVDVSQRLAGLTQFVGGRLPG